MITREGKIYSVERLRRKFISTHNPVYAWQAYREARRLEVPIPEEIIQYIDGVASGVISTFKRPPAAKDRPRALSRALGLSKEGAGPGSAFTEYEKSERKRILAVETAHMVEEFGDDKNDYAFDEIAKQFGESKSTVRRNYIDHLKYWREEAAFIVSAGIVRPGPDGRLRYDRLVGTQKHELWEDLIIFGLVENLQNK